MKWSGVKTQHSTTPFVDEMYERLKETLNDYVVIICRWPEYTFVLENVWSDYSCFSFIALRENTLVSSRPTIAENPVAFLSPL